MDRLDWAILAALEGDGRISYGALGETVGLSKTPCWTRVQRLEEQGVITGYRATIDRQKIGLTLVAFCEVAVDFIHHRDFETAVLEHPAILECYSTAGKGDYLLKILCRDVDHLDAILRLELSSVAGLVRSSTTIALKAIKQEARMVALAIKSRSPGF